MGFFDRLDNYMTGPQRRAADLANEANALRVRQAQREEENLLRRQGMANFATSPSLEAAYPEMIAQDQQRNALDQADPAAALGRLESKLYPGPDEIMMGKPGEVPLNKRTGAPVGSAVPGGGPVFSPKKMRIPETNRIVMARTPEEYDANIEAGFVDDTGAVPGPAKDDNEKDYKRVDYWRDKVDPEYKAVSEASISYDKIERAIQGGASMSTAIQLLQKIIDERGVVRGEDVRMFNDAQPLLESWKQELKNSTDGKLTKESADRVLNTARALVGARYSAFNNNFDAYVPLMQGESVKPGDVIPQQALDRFSMRRFQQPPQGAAVTAQAGGAQIPTPQSAEDYNSLPSGAVYIDPDDGRQYRKP